MDDMHALAKFLHFNVGDRTNPMQISQSLDDKDIGSLALACPELEEVDLSKNYRMTAKAVEQLARNCAQLRSLNLAATKVEAHALQPLIDANIFLDSLNRDSSP